ENPPETMQDPLILDAMDLRLRYIDEATRYRNRPEDLLTLDPDLWTIDRVVEDAIALDNPRVVNVIPQDPDVLLTLFDQATQTFAFGIERAALRRIPHDLAGGLADAIVRTGDDHIRLAARRLDVTAVNELLMEGATPTYPVKDEILNRMRRIRNALPL